MIRISTALLASLAWVTFSFTAQAQDAYNDNSDMATTPPVGAAQLDVRLSQLEEQMRQLQGKLEQVTYENKQLKTQLDKANSDNAYRLDALEKRGSAPVAAVPAQPINVPPAQSGLPDSSQLRPTESPIPESDANDGDPIAATPAQPVAAAPQKFSNSREQYNYAFKILQQARYAEAGAAFSVFTKQYPKDPLVGNAYYWQGESYYVQRDYVKAADSFRQGYESMPTGPKGQDNLLKLAMSLDALKKDKEACVVLKQVVAHAPPTSSVKPRAEQEINRIGCTG